MPAVSVDKTESRSEWSSSPGAQKTPLNKGILGGDGGEGFEPSRDLTAPSDFRDLLYFVSTMRSEGQCATQRATVVAYEPSSLLAPQNSRSCSLETAVDPVLTMGRLRQPGATHGNSFRLSGPF